MEKPRIEVVRFDIKDVITTSSFQRVRNYAANGEKFIADKSEVTTGNVSGNPGGNYQWYMLEYNDGAFRFLGCFGDEGARYADNRYTWYDNGDWWTEGKNWSDYNGHYRYDNN